jgi:hypothetical protein
MKCVDGVEEKQFLNRCNNFIIFIFVIILGDN